MFEVIAKMPTAGQGEDGDQRSIGPFSVRSAAERAACELITDPRRWAIIKIVEVADVD